MKQTLYNNLEKSLSTTDLLALERNLLANERTLLAYVRTFLSFSVAGVSLVQFFDNKYFVVFGFMLMPLGVIILVVGFMRFLKVKRQILAIRQGKK